MTDPAAHPTGKARGDTIAGRYGKRKNGGLHLRLAADCWRREKRAMILVPEIALTPQMMARFSMYFGEDVALLHSALGIAERYDQYKRIRQGLVKIVLGTRSAVFAPLPELGMIVIDEEQENSYESENRRPATTPGILPNIAAPRRVHGWCWDRRRLRWRQLTWPERGDYHCPCCENGTMKTRCPRCPLWICARS